MEKLSIDDLDLNGKKVLMRVDFNVPQDKDGNIADDSRVQAALHSINYVLDHGGSLILMSHLGRPKKPEQKFSLKPLAKRLSQLIDRDIKMAPDSRGSDVENMAQNLKKGQVLLLENLRFHEAEKQPESDPDFALQLSKLADVYINDAFGTAHRKHSSTYEVAKYFPDAAAAGFLMKKEMEHLGKILRNPSRPFYAIIGGAKISTKMGVLNKLLEKVDGLFLCGAMANTFLKAKGIEIGDSMYEEEYLGVAEDILEKCGKKTFLPVDVLAVKEIKSGQKPITVDLANEGMPQGYRSVDIGPKTVDIYNEKLRNAKTVLWNGPAGVFEIKDFASGTGALAKILASLNAETIIGGGDSAYAVRSLGLSEEMSHISTGGGASLEFIEKGTLPGIEVLSTRSKEKI